MRIILLFVFLISLSIDVFADEPIFSKEQLLSEGYQIFHSRTISRSGKSSFPIKTLPWPVQFKDASHTIANSMAQFQPFSTPGYFHLGCDLIVNMGEKVFTPVGGRLEAGHYSYTNNDDGSKVKYWKPWPETGNSTYFEIAVVNEGGYRFEYHHMDRDTLPKEIVDILNNGGGYIPAGTYVGRAVYFSSDYHHIHYNVIAPNQIAINPEAISLPIPDHKAPEIFNVFAVYANGDVISLKENSQLNKRPIEFVVWTRDQLDGSVYDQPPTLSMIEFESGEKVSWDFREKLADSNGKLPNLFNFILTELKVGKDILRSEGGYGIGRSLIRLSVPKLAHGKFVITAQDISGNSTKMTGNIKL
ncbi:MAG: hypothetical protein V4596_13460 [Bdellovibrionota bacterium]